MTFVKTGILTNGSWKLLDIEAITNRPPILPLLDPINNSSYNLLMA